MWPQGKLGMCEKSKAAILKFMSQAGSPLLLFDIL